MIEKPGISPLYTERKFSITKEELDKIDDPNVLAAEIEKMDNATERINEETAFIRPESESDREATKENFRVSIESLGETVGSLDGISEIIFSNPDQLHISVFKGTIEAAEKQIESLDGLYKKSEVDSLTYDKYEQIKAKLAEYKQVDTEKLQNAA